MYHLLPYQRCAAHTLNLIATTDAEDALRDKNFKKYQEQFLRNAKVYGTNNQGVMILKLEKNVMDYSCHSTPLGGTLTMIQCLK